MAYGQFTSKKVDQSVFIDEDLNPVVINHPPPPQPVNQTPPPPQQKVTLERAKLHLDNCLENGIRERPQISMKAKANSR